MNKKTKKRDDAVSTITSANVWKKKKDGPKTCWLKTFRRIEK